MTFSDLSFIKEGEIEKALYWLEYAGCNKSEITVLHCNTEYPTPYGDVNLRTMQTIAKALNVRVGLSDHTLGIEIPIAVAALGASVIEKHFTLDHSQPLGLRPGSRKSAHQIEESGTSLLP